jgi:hypothetical protein
VGMVGRKLVLRRDWLRALSCRSIVQQALGGFMNGCERNVVPILESPFFAPAKLLSVHFSTSQHT